VSDGYEIWSVPGKPVSVHVRSTVAGQIRALANDSADQTLECGGILWGRVRDAGDGYFLVSIEDAGRLACEHARGEGWALSDSDRKELSKTLKHKNGDLRPVGFWRSHRRPGLYLDMRDFELMRDFFASPWCIAVCVRPPSKAGFFFWEGGDIHRTSSYREFDLPDAVQPANTPPGARRLGRNRWAIAAGLAALTVTPFLLRSTNSTGTPFNMLSMRAERKPGSVRLKWDPNSKVLRGANGAIVWIADGLDESKLELTREQVRTGTLDYKPLTGDVNFRMQVGDFAESLRVIGEPPQTPAVTAALEPIPPPAEPVRKPKRQKSEPVVREIPQAAAPAREQTVERSRVIEPPAPPQIALGPARLERPPLPSRPIETPKVVATVEPPPSNPIKKVFRWMKIPGLRKDKDFTPPRPIRQVQPHVAVMEPTSVAVRVAIDYKGNVWDAEMLTKDVDSKLGLSAIQAAKRWRFEPARMDDKPVASDVVVRFRFGEANP
jgi:periplasmic protein TonB